MFENLFGAKKPKEGVSPLAGAGTLSKLIAELPQDDETARLSAINDWLEEFPAHVVDLGVVRAVEALLEFDAAAYHARERLIENYFRTGMPGFGSTALLERLSAHFALIGAAYTQVFDAFASSPAAAKSTPILLAGIRCLHAWGRHRRIGRFHQRPPGKESWGHAHQVLLQLMAANMHHNSMPVFAGAPESTPLREYLTTVYEETIPWGSLLPVQLELTARLIGSLGTLGWQQKADGAVTHTIDLAANEPPRRYNADTCVPGPTIRFLSTGKLFSAVSELLDSDLDTLNLPASFGPLTIDPLQITAALQTLAGYWDQQPPERQSERAGRFEPARGAFGFVTVRALVEATQSVFKGLGKVTPAAPPVQRLHSEFERSFAAYGYGDVNREERDAAAVKGEGNVDDSLVRLANIERGISNLSVEQWTELDISASGLGIALPALLPRHAIGALVACRGVASVQWRIGILRRVARDHQGKPIAGIELLSGTPLPGVLQMLRKPAASETGAWAEWVLVILPDAAAKQVLAPSGSFIADMPVELISDAGQRHAVMKRLVERAGDWDRIEIG